MLKNERLISFSSTLQKSQLSLAGGRNATQQVYNTLDALMPAHVGANFSWTGKGGHKADANAPVKMVFGDTKLSEAVIGECTLS